MAVGATGYLYSYASTGYWPWSGSWWPMYEGSTSGPNLYSRGGPLELYDWYVWNTRGYNPNTANWERANHQTNDPNLSWAGSCHAWSAASIMVNDPPASGVTRNGVYFSQDALEGLITALYFNPTYRMLAGTRSNTDNVNSAEYQDMNPAWMDYLLKYYIDDYSYPFIMDTAAGAQVWNFPVFSYQSWKSNAGNGVTNVTTRVWYSDARAGAATTQYFYKDYTYQLWNTADGRMSGRWTGNSYYDHPDYAWVPTGRSSEGVNPGLDPSIVSEILGYQV